LIKHVTMNNFLRGRRATVTKNVSSAIEKLEFALRICIEDSSKNTEFMQQIAPLHYLLLCSLEFKKNLPWLSDPHSTLTRLAMNRIGVMISKLASDEARANE